VLRELLASDLPTAEAAREAIKAGYQRLAFEHVPAYRVLFDSVRNGELPLVFNCSAGKDRAGTTAALLLAALGVPRATILQDYGMTDRILDVARLTAPRASTSHGGQSMMSRVQPEVIAVVMGTHPSYLGCVFDAIAAKYQTIEAYLQQELALSAETLHAIRDALLE
jgi:protein-tyrosine phosphatase